MSFFAYRVGAVGIIVLGYHFEWFGILVAATAVASGLAIGLAALYLFWTKARTGDLAASGSDLTWLCYHAPLLIPAIWAAIAAVLFACILATRAISCSPRPH